jgi:acetolactate synthase-1/2/3 large subunit
LAGAALTERGLTVAGRVAAATGAELKTETFYSRIRRGAGVVNADRLPYFAEDIQETLAGVKHIVQVGSKAPVAFFAYPGKDSWLTPDGCELHQLSAPEEDAVAALEALADELGAPADPIGRVEASRPDLPSGNLTAGTAGTAIAALLPAEAIISDEAATSGLASYMLSAGADPFDQMQLTGGSIGQGLPLATGAAVACPDRKVVCLHGDGGAMYTLQALWTQARENLDVVTVIFANRSYAILNIELMRVGAENPGPKALSMLDLSNPTLDWVQLAQGMGVEASRAETAEDFSDQFASAVAAKGPRLIEAVI